MAAQRSWGKRGERGLLARERPDYLHPTLGLQLRIVAQTGAAALTVVDRHVATPDLHVHDPLLRLVNLDSDRVRVVPAAADGHVRAHGLGLVAAGDELQAPVCGGGGVQRQREGGGARVVACEARGRPAVDGGAYTGIVTISRVRRVGFYATG